MKPYSASAAAKAVGKSVPTITRAIKSGRLSAVKLEGGGYEIDPSELHRLWPAVTRNPNMKVNMSGSETPDETHELQGKVEALQAEKVSMLEKRVADLETERDEWRKQAQRLALAAPTGENSPDPLRSDPEKNRGLFGWFGKAKTA